MCCEDCPRYERCYKDGNFKKNCCPKCPEYNDCAGTGENENSFERGSDDFEYEDYSE